MWPEILTAAFALLAASLGFILFRAMRREAALREELGGLRSRTTSLSDELAVVRAEAGSVDVLKAEAVRLETALEHERRGSDNKIRLLEQAEERLKKEFENLAGRILEERGKALADQSREKVTAVLQPLKEQLEAFRKRVDEVHTEDTRHTVSIIEQIGKLKELSTRVSQDAENLAKAIKGDAKVRGNWGELVVRRLLESAGLVEGRHFDAQKLLEGDDGTRFIPDFLLYLPGDRVVILDSKVSLVAYERFVSEDDEAAAGKAMKEHVASVRRHLTDLGGKSYESLLGGRTLDFVLMCIPVEPAFQAALSADPELQYDAAGGSVLVTGPVTLMLMLKLVTQFWRRDDEARNTREIAERASAIYDKVRLVAESMETSRSRASQLTQSLDEAFDRLASGRGSLVSQVETMRKLGLKVRERIPEKLTGTASEAGSEVDAGTGSCEPAGSDAPAHPPAD